MVIGKPSDRLIAVLLLGVFLVLVGRVVFTRHYWPRADSGAFISASVALNQGIGLRDITAPVTKPDDGWAMIPSWVKGDPNTRQKPDWPLFIQYPPLLPILLLPFVHLGEGNFLVMQLLPILFGLGSLFLLYRWRFLFFQDIWLPVLLITIFSSMTLYSTRIQSEIPHAFCIIVAMRILIGMSGAGNPSFGSFLLLIGVLFAAGAIHGKIVFFCGGVAAWLVLSGPIIFTVPKGPITPAMSMVPLRLGESEVPVKSGAAEMFSGKTLLLRLVAAALFLILTAGPVIWWFQNASWADGNFFDLRDNPYFRRADLGDFHDPVRVRPGILEIVQVAADRLSMAGYTMFQSLWLDSWAVRREVGYDMLLEWFFITLFVYLLLVRGCRIAWKNGRSALVLPVCMHIFGCANSPWFEPRMLVPVMPFFVYLLVLGLGAFSGGCGVGEGAPVSALFERWKPRIRLGFVLFLLATQIGQWINANSRHDLFATESHSRLAPIVNIMERIGTGRTALVRGDHHAFSLLSGCTSINQAPNEWKTTHAGRFLGAGAPCLVIAMLFREQLPPTYPFDPAVASFAVGMQRCELTTGWGDFMVGAIRSSLPASWPEEGTLEASVARDRVHPRWFSIGPGDRERFRMENLVHTASSSEGVSP
ncbi:MAG: hypothetical protein WA705_08660 [Candidatus Ozemobacteraceae bacterium]